MADNLDPVTDNQDQTTTADNTSTATAPAPATESFSWKSSLGPDLSKAANLGNFEDSKSGLADLAKSYISAQQLMGHKKAPLPNGPDDKEGIAAFNKAIGVPASPELYNLEDAVLPEAMGGGAFDKGAFQQVVHKHGLTPQQAAGLWKDYTEISKGEYSQMQKNFQDTLNQNINQLRKEWGDAYAANVELADMAISKLAENKDQGDWLTATLAKNPHGLKWAAKVGNLLAENKVGDFQYKRFSMTPEEAQNEVAKIKNDPSHPYGNPNATEKDHQAAVDHVNRLIAISMGRKM